MASMPSVEVFHLDGQHDQQSHAGDSAAADDYRGGHRPSETGPRIHDLLESEMTDGLDVYENPQFFTGYSKLELRQTMAQLQRVKGDPEAKVTIYRAAPEGADINPGDWVTLSRAYAETHMDSGNAGEAPALLQLEVPAKTVRWAVDDLMEYGYFPDLGEQRIFSEDDLAVQVFHLDGQHDQQSHAGGRRRPIPPPPRGGRGRPRPGGALPDVPFRDVKIAYRPRHPDGKADPGEVVWAQVPFEEGDGRSKDRPVLIIGRTADGEHLVGVQLTSKSGRDRVPVGTGDWDRQARESYMDTDRFIQVDENNYRREGAYLKKPRFQEIVDVLTERQNAPDVDLAYLDEWIGQFHLQGQHDQQTHGGGRPFSSQGKKLAERYQSRPRDLEPGDVVRFKPPKTTDRGATKAGNPRLVVNKVDRKPYSVTVHFDTGEKYTYDNSDGDVLDVEVWEQVEDFSVRQFHLQGQHDQQSHAGDRAVDPTSPAARRGWKPLKGVLSERPIEFDDYENRYRVTAANGEQVEARVFTGSAESSQVLRSPAWQQRIADGLNGAVDGYDADPTPDVPHVIVIDELPFGLPDVAAAAIAFVASGNRPGPAPESIPWDASALQGNTITFNATPLGREMWELMEERAPEIMMPSVKSTSVANYTGIHEYGHTRAVLDGIPFINEMYDTIRPLSLSSITPEWKQLSRYGKINPAEAHAETYADWVLSQGVSDNAATSVYAERFGWGEEREDALAAAAGATRLRDQWVYCFDGPKGGILVTKAPEGVDFHLDGQHDQQTHAGGRGSAPDSPVAESSADIRTEGARNEDRPDSRAALNGSNEPLPFLPQAPLDLGEVQAVEMYMGLGIILNSQLRSGRVTSNNERSISNLDAAFEQSPGFTEDTDVYRLVPRELTVHPKGDGWGDPPGFTDDGYLSTTYDKEQLQGISDVLGYQQTHVPIKIRVPAGTKGLHISDSRFQSEVLLPRGGTVKPVGFDNGEYVWGFETEDTDG